MTVSSAIYADGRFAPGVTIERSRGSGNGHSLSASASVSRYVEVGKGAGMRLRTDADGRRIEQATVNATAGGVTGYAQATGERPALGGQLRLNGTLTWTDYRNSLIDGAFYPNLVTTMLHEDLGGVGGGKAGSLANWVERPSARAREVGRGGDATLMRRVDTLRQGRRSTLGDDASDLFG